VGEGLRQLLEREMKNRPLPPLRLNFSKPWLVFLEGFNSLRLKDTKERVKESLKVLNLPLWKLGIINNLALWRPSFNLLNEPSGILRDCWIGCKVLLMLLFKDTVLEKEKRKNLKNLRLTKVVKVVKKERTKDRAKGKTKVLTKRTLHRLMRALGSRLQKRNRRCGNPVCDLLNPQAIIG
jgi:hypothetical protein